MEKVVQHAAKYLGAVIGFLVILALYFFFKMNQSLSADQSYIDDIVEENQTLTSQSAELESKLTAFSKKVSELESEISDKQSTIEQIQQLDNDSDLSSQCAALPPSDEFVSIKRKLEKVRQSQESCSATLDKRNDEVRSLEKRVKTLRDSSDSLENTETAMQELREELATLREENELLLQQNTENDGNVEELASITELNSELTGQLEELKAKIQSLQQDTSSTRLETQLAQANAENKRLQSLLSESQGETEESSPTAISGELQIVSFDAEPNFCSETYQDGSRCVVSVDVTATFNFRPGGFIAMRATGPNGSTIDRQSIAGRTVTKFTIEFDSDEPSSVGAYTVELSTNDVLNPLKVTKSFTISSTN
jgi:phage shock protein A